MPTIHTPTVEIYEERYLLFHNVRLLSSFLSNPYVSSKHGYRTLRVTFLFPIEPKERVQPLWDHLGHYCMSHGILIDPSHMPVRRGDIATNLHDQLLVSAKNTVESPPTLLDRGGAEIQIHESYPTFQPGSIVKFLGSLYAVRNKNVCYCALSIAAMQFVAPGEKPSTAVRSPVQVAHEAFKIAS